MLLPKLAVQKIYLAGLVAALFASACSPNLIGTPLKLSKGLNATIALSMSAPSSTVVAGQTLAITTSGGKPTYSYSLLAAGGTLVASGAAGATFTAGTAVGVAQLKVTDSSGSMMTLPITVVPDVPAVATSTIIAAPASALADGVATVTATITLLDQYSNPISGVQPVIAATGASNTISACGFTNAAGISTCTVASTAAESKTLSITSPIAKAGPAVSFTSSAPVVANSTLSATTPVTADGASTSTVTITFNDILNNPVSGVTPTITISGTGNSAPSCGVSNASGVATCTFTSTKAETKNVNLTGPIALGPQAVVFNPGAAAIATSTITGTGPVFADGVATSTVTVTILDAQSNAISGVTPTFTATNTGAGNTQTACSATDASGVSTCTLRSTQPEVKTLSIATPIVKAGGTVTFESTSPATANSTIVGTGPVLANGVATSTVTITLKNDLNTPLAGVVPTFSATDTGTTNSYGVCSATNVSGVSTCTLASTKAEVKTLSIATPISKSDGTVTFTVGAPAVATSTITGTSPVLADGSATSTVTVTVRDAFSNPVSGITPTFTATDTGSTNAYTACSVSDASGVSTCTMTSTKAEVKTLSIATPVAKAGGTVTFTAGAAVAATSTITGTSTPIADNIDTSTITITLRDVNSNPVSGQTPTFSATGTANTYNACSVTNASGVSTCTMVTTKAETKTLSITSGFTKADGTVTFKHGPATKIVWTAQVQDTNPNAGISGTAEIRDQYDNLVNTGVDATANVTVSKISGTGTLSGTTVAPAVGGVFTLGAQGLTIDLIGKKILRVAKADTTGSAGTIARQADGTDFYISNVLCDSGQLHTGCTISSLKSVPANDTFQGTDNLLITGTGELRNTTNKAIFAMNFAGTVTIQSGGKITGNVWPLAATNIDLQSGAILDANGLGYFGGKVGTNASADGEGTGGGINACVGPCAGGGGGHGGAGAAGTAAGATGGSAYDVNTDPADFGSGGAAGWNSTYPGGNGGGKISLNIPGTATLNGTITVDGTSADLSGGGGAGGSIKVVAGTVAGTGTLSARGRETAEYANAPGGTGAGGMILISSSGLFSGSVLYDGERDWARSAGGLGTFQSLLGSADQICDSGSIAGTCTISSPKAWPQNLLNFAAANLTVQAGGVGGGRIMVTPRTEWLTLTISGTATIDGWIEANIKKLEANALTVSGKIIGNVGSPDSTNYPGIINTPNITFTSTAQIDASGKGYRGASRSGFMGYVHATGPLCVGEGPDPATGGGKGTHLTVWTGGGGSHGGIGGVSGEGSTTHANASTTYDSMTNPTDYGSGGGAGWNCTYTGQNGGGIVRINTAGSLVHDGSVIADGSSDFNNNLLGGGGAGGTIHLTAATLSGTGSLYARGSRGDGWSYGTGYPGGGGGGRIYVNANTLPSGIVDVEGGSGGVVGRAGARGTYYADIPVNGLCDTGTMAGTCTISTMKTLSQNILSLSFNTLTVASGGGLRTPSRDDWVDITSTGDISFQSGSQVIGNIKRIEPTGIFTLAAGVTFWGNVGGPNDVTHPGIKSTNTVTISGTINASGAGYRGGGALNWYDRNGEGSGGGTGYINWANQEPGGGGGYAGAGASGGTSTTHWNAPFVSVGGTGYGVANAPSDFGSGGGSGHALGYAGGNGGGLIRVVTTSTLSASGNLFADGADGTLNSGGGSGGTVYLSGSTVSGGGIISARGGYGSEWANTGGGGGSGGRVYIASARPFDGTLYLIGRTQRFNASSTSWGTYYNTLPNNDAVCDSGTWATTCNIGSNRVWGQNTLTHSGAALNFSSGWIVLPTRDDALNITLTGAATIAGNIAGNVDKLSAASIDISGTITGNAGGPDGVAQPGITATGNVSISGTVDANSAGYLGGLNGVNGTSNGMGPGGGVADFATVYPWAFGGGSFGGKGADGLTGSAFAGNTNGSATNPANYGSGGGGSWFAGPGGNGGGMIRVTSGATLTLGGILRTDGGTAEYTSGGGSGGTIRISAPTFTGAGSVSSVGGMAINSWNGGGSGGGGGRILVDVASAYSFSGSYDVRGGYLNGTQRRRGGAGTFRLNIPSDDMYCSSGSWAAGTCTIAGTFTLPDNFAPSNPAGLTLSSGAVLRTTSPDKWLTLELTGPFVSNGATISSNIAKLSATAVTFNSGSQILGNVGSTDTVNEPGIVSSGAFTLASGATINADYLGDAGGNPALAPTNNGGGSGGGQGGNTGAGGCGGGGGHGGVGGKGGGAAGICLGGSAYGNASNPATYGSGGGTNVGAAEWGGNGGGIIRISAGGATLLDGTLSTRGANGQADGWTSGGGSGGSIRVLSTGTVSGAGTLRATGGTGGTSSSLSWYTSGAPNGSGSGSGGRIAIEAPNLFLGSVDVRSGLLWGQGAEQGQDGTYYSIIPSVDGICNSGTVAGTCTISGDRLIGDNLAMNTFGNLTVSSSGSVRFANDKYVALKAAGGTISVSGTITGNLSRLEASTVTIGATGIIRGNIGSPASFGGYPGIIASAFSLASGGLIDASALGYYGANSGGAFWGYNAGPGGGAYQTSGVGTGGGAGYGGAGGIGDARAAGGTTYGSSTNPTDFGSGGAAHANLSGEKGGRGGGVVFATISGNAAISGTIRVNGGADTSGQGGSGGGGSGGSVNLAANTFSGTGTVEANGGNGGNGASWGAGGGGGGRIAVVRGGGAAFGGTTSASGGSGTMGSTSGAAGTVYKP